jgi:protein-disulfide isomerase
MAASRPWKDRILLALIPPIASVFLRLLGATWKVRIVGLKPSPFPELYQGNIEFRFEDNVRFQNLFVTRDSRYYIVGNLFDVNVDLDALRREKIALKGAPFKGSANAPVTIVEYTDLQCGSCKQAHEAIQKDKVLEAYPGKVRYVYKNLPLSRFHPWALQAAVACMCAYRQGREAFWKMQNDIFSDQGAITVENLRDKVIGSTQGSRLDIKKFQECFDNRGTLDLVNADIAEAGALGVGSTPTFFVNGRVVAGYPGSAQLKLLIEEFLSKK